MRSGGWYQGHASLRSIPLVSRAISLVIHILEPMHQDGRSSTREIPIKSGCRNPDMGLNSILCPLQKLTWNLQRAPINTTFKRCLFQAPCQFGGRLGPWTIFKECSQEPYTLSPLPFNPETLNFKPSTLNSKP